MENSTAPSPSSSQAAEDLAAAREARNAVLGGLSLPSRHSLLTGAGNAVLAYGIAVSNSGWRFASLALVVALGVSGAAFTAAMRLFRNRNGASASGLNGPGSARLVTGSFAAILVLCIVGATLLMTQDRPVAAALIALSALPATALADRLWMARYRRGR